MCANEPLKLHAFFFFLIAANKFILLHPKGSKKFCLNKSNTNVEHCCLIICFDYAWPPAVVRC